MRLRTLNRLLGLLILFLGLATTAKAQTFDTIDPPNASPTYSFSINAAGEVTGYFSDGSQNNKERFFVRDRNGDITVFDAPKAAYTHAASINAREDVVGNFSEGIRPTPLTRAAALDE